MLFKLWRMVQLMLPYWVVINLYKHNRALPANIRTVTGKNLKAVMITEKYGIIFTSGEYYSNRVKYLQKVKDELTMANDNLTQEINELSFEARELFLRRDDK